MNSANDNELCRDEQRRHDARKKQYNGLDYVEVGPDQLTLKLFFIGSAPKELDPSNFRIDGGTRIRGIRVLTAIRTDRAEDDLDDYWCLTVDRVGDFSNYTLRIVKPDAQGRPGELPLDGFDPRYSRLEFTFKAECPTDLDCRLPAICPPPAQVKPEINYLAKDYASFRQLILDRLAVVIPDWRERHVPDLGITLVELLAYVGDHLSYYQDAVATEAYLDTSRQRISVRRHARLVDYYLHEGCNARTWVTIKTTQDVSIDLSNIYFITSLDEKSGIKGEMVSADELQIVPASEYEVFEPLIGSHPNPRLLYKAQNEINFYTWGNRDCCLPRGATRGTLSCTSASGSNPVELHLRPGDVLIFEEVKGAKTGNPADAIRAHRHPVRLTNVMKGKDPLYNQDIVEIEWDLADALPFALCISAVLPIGNSCIEVNNISVARGNVILADHGRTIVGESLSVPPAIEHTAGCLAIGQPHERSLHPAPFKAILKSGPLTHRETYPRLNQIARRQSSLRGQLPERLDALINSLLLRVLEGNTVSDNEFAALRTIYGQPALFEAGLINQAGVRVTLSQSEQTVAIQKLIANSTRSLKRKRRRLGTLRARAEAGYVLNDLMAHEIGEMFGQQYGEELLSSNPNLFGAAGSALSQDPRESLPDISVSEKTKDQFHQWHPRRDLLDSNGKDRHFVTEVDNDGLAHLRFGDDILGHRPESESQVEIRYRVGNGNAGNVGAETISRVIFRNGKLSGINLLPRNPFPAQGGREPEPMAEARLFAPGAFRKQLERAITADDYARLAERNQKIQRAAAELRWSGSWNEATVAVDPLGTEATSEELLGDIERHLGQYRRVGHDLRVTPARYVPLDLELTVCVGPQYLRGHVLAVLRDLFSNRLLPDGQRGFFHPDNLSFGEGVYASRLIGTAMAVTGVESVRLTKLQRLYEPPNSEVENGLLPLKPFEVAQLDNNPSFPERGKLSFILRGGR